MSAAMLDLLESCFEDEADRPADAGLLAEKLGMLLKPAADEDPKKNGTGSARPSPIVVPGPQKEVAKRPSPIVVPEPQKEVVNSIGMKLKLIPVGEFQMGSTEHDSE